MVKKNLMIRLFVLTQLTNVTDTRTYTHTPRHTDTAWRHRPRLCIASRGKNSSRKIVRNVENRIARNSNNSTVNAAQTTVGVQTGTRPAMSRHVTGSSTGSGATRRPSCSRRRPALSRRPWRTGPTVRPRSARDSGGVDEIVTERRHCQISQCRRNVQRIRWPTITTYCVRRSVKRYYLSSSTCIHFSTKSTHVVAAAAAAATVVAVMYVYAILCQLRTSGNYFHHVLMITSLTDVRLNSMLDWVSFCKYKNFYATALGTRSIEVWKLLSVEDNSGIR